jgi:hypothetical protein
MVPSKRMAGNYMTMPITPLCLEVRNIVFRIKATYAYSSEIQGDSLIKDVMTPINLKGASTEFTIFRQRKD